MHKVMVVDDEAMGRKAIGKMIGELGLEAEVVAEARHGEEALALLRLDKPHIIVTDMNMPVMNGQRFLEALHRDYPEIKVIVISGYSQFDYLKAALTYQACEYVLKPVSMGDLRDAMLKAIEAVREFSSRQLEKRSSEEALKLRREAFLQHVSGRRITNAADIAKMAAELGIGLADDRYRIAVCLIRQFGDISRTKFHGNADLYMFSLENMLSEVLADDRALLYKSDDRMRLCLVLPRSRYPDLRVGEVLGSFQQAVQHTLGGDVVAGLGPEFAGLDKLPEAYARAFDALADNAFAGKGLCASAGEPARRETPELLSAFDLKQLAQAFGTGNAKDARRLLDGFVRRVAAHPEATIRDVQRELARIAELATAEMRGIAAGVAASFGARSAERIADMRELQAFADRLATAAEQHGQSRAMPESGGLIREIVQYLDEHYFEDVGLIEIATRFYMDPSYLSKLFKSVTDENFIEYVTRKRMEKACELLRSPERKINEVAELVGYENQRYFSQVFKKFTGRTPSEYRESLEQDGTE